MGERPAERKAMNKNNILPEVKLKYVKGNFDKIKIESSKEAFLLCEKLFDVDTLNYQERIVIVFTNRANITIGWHTLSVGGITASIFDHRIVFAMALKIGATGILVAHNHPSGNPTPSPQDIALTFEIKEVCKLLKITLLDHLILFEENNRKLSFTSLCGLGYC